MKPREKVNAAISGEEIFPIPTDVFENGIYPILAGELCEHFALDKADHRGLIRALGAHLRWAKPVYVGPPLEEVLSERVAAFPCEKITRNMWGTISGIGSYADLLSDRPLSSAETVGDIERYNWPDPDWLNYERIGWFFTDDPGSYLSPSQWAEKYSDYARVVGGWDPVFSRIMDLFGMEKGLMHMASRPDLIHATVAHIGDFLEEYYKRLAGACKGYSDILGFGDDFAEQNGMLLNPQKWREYFLPLWKRLFGIAHKHNLKTMMHMCGAVRPVLGDLIDAGLDIYQVVQVTAVGMKPQALKREFGKDLTFYGGIDTQYLLPHGKTEEVKLEVRKTIDIMGKGGRYILASMHFLMDDVPYENVLAMYEEAQFR